MTPIDQWSDGAFGVTLEGDLPTPIESVTLARGPGTRRFAENAYHTLLAVTLLAVIVGLCLAARRLTP